MKRIIFVVLALVMLGAGVGYYLWNKPHPKVEDTKGISISAVDLYKEFASNEQAANNKFLSSNHDKAIEVTGVVSETESNMDGGLMVVLGTDDPIAGVQCAMRDQKQDVKKGTTITIKGFCSGVGITGVTLTDCVVIK